MEHSPDCKILCVSTDVTDPASVTKLFEEAVKGGKIDILINNAGAEGILFPVGLGDKELWWNSYVGRHHPDSIL